MTNTTTNTIANQIAERFGNDGLNWTDDRGFDLDEVCEELARQEWRDGYRVGDTYRYEFEDGSAIVVSGDAWDIEGSTPFSWAGVEEQWGAEYDASDLILCVSPDGWSYHAPGSTDEQIAEGDAPPIHAGPGTPTKADRQTAFRMWAAENRRQIVVEFDEDVRTDALTLYAGRYLIEVPPDYSAVQVREDLFRDPAIRIIRKV